MKVIGYYAGPCVNSALMCLNHAVTDEFEPITLADLPEGFICDRCGRATEKARD